MHLAHYNKAIVSLVMAVLVILDQATGWSLPFLNEAWITALLAVITPILVWWVPNR